jgi:hypothetical protein
VARQAAPYSALNDWHGFFFCRPRFPRLRAVLAVARTARACCCALARRAGARPTTPPARVMSREAATAAAVAAAVAAAARGSERGCKAGARPVAALRDLKAVVAGSVTLSVRLQHHSKLDSSRRYHRDQIKRVLILLLLLTLSLPRSLLRAPGGSSGGSTRRKRLGGRQEASTSTQSSKRALRRGAFGRCFSVATGACNSPHTPPNPLFARHSPRP